MVCCTSRCFLLTLCVIQLIATVERQIFDFLGYMWSPIVVNFIQVIVVILGFFGAYQFRPKYIAVYIIWTLLWLAWNIFIICFYLEIGILNKDSSVLNMGTGSKSWWETHGIGCKSSVNFSTSERYHYFSLPTTVEGCVLQYYYIECIQAGLQCFLAFWGFGTACYTFYIYTREDDTSIARVNSKNLPYSIEYRSQSIQDGNGTLYQRPMTPRKVKQRSTKSKRGSSRQRYYQNPVTKLMDNRSIDTSSHDSYCTADLYRGQSNPLYCSSKSNSQPEIRPNSVLYFNGRPSPIYMNDSDTVI